MAVGDMISKLRTAANMSQEQFAELFGVTRQSVQKWENSFSVPELEKLIKISKYFDVSLDALVLRSDARVTEELNYNKTLKPKYANMHEWNLFCRYAYGVSAVHRRGFGSGCVCRCVFGGVPASKNETKKKLADVLFDVVFNAKTAENYTYIEPSTLDEIKNLRKNEPLQHPVCAEPLDKKFTVRGWAGFADAFWGKRLRDQNR